MVQRFISPLIAAIALTVSACNAPAPSGEKPADAPAVKLAAITTAEAWAATTPNGAPVGAGYFTVTNNTDEPDKLVSASSPRAPHVEIHEMAMDGDMMRMRRVDGIEVPGHGSVSLAPGGYHLMFMEIKAPFVVGEMVPVTLTFEHAGAVEISLPVRDRDPADEMSDDKH